MDPFAGIPTMDNRAPPPPPSSSLPTSVADAISQATGGAKKHKKKKGGTKRTREEEVHTIFDAPVVFTATNKKRKTAPKTLSEEDKEAMRRCQDKILCIRAHLTNDHLGPVLKDRGVAYSEARLRKMDEEELLLVEAEIDQVLSSQSFDLVGDFMLKGGLEAIETWVSKLTPLRPDGATQRCFEKKAFLFSLERCKLKYLLQFGRVDPLTECTMMIGQAYWQMHLLNSAGEHGLDLHSVKVEVPDPPEL